jgi:site-specific recombinase XerD
MLLEAGANPKDVQHRLGHKNIEVTLQIYSHVTLKMQNDTISILENIPEQ